jgi:hypothetical protein
MRTSSPPQATYAAHCSGFGSVCGRRARRIFRLVAPNSIRARASALANRSASDGRSTFAFDTVNDMDSEPIITINGQLLTRAQAMTVRVACGHFGIYLEDFGLGPDPLGHAIAVNYLARLKEVTAIMK